MTVDKKVNEVSEEKEWDTDLVFTSGTELIFTAQKIPIHYGIGIGIKTSQTHDDQRITPAALPIWANINYTVYSKYRFFSVYVATRGGTLLPFTSDGNWWERPFNFFLEGGLGINVPCISNNYNVGLEVNYNYTSMLRSFVDKNTSFWFSGSRIGIQLSFGIELTHERQP